MTPNRLAALHAICFTTPRPWSAAEFASLLSVAGTFLCRGDTGFLLGRTAGPEAELLTLAVHPKARGHGLGRRLLAEFETTARQNGAQQAFLEVAINNPVAIALYRTAGYGESGLRPDYYTEPDGQKLSAYVMSRHLEVAS